MRKIFIAIFTIILGLLYFTPILAQEMDQLTLSITPPLIKNNVNPGQIWQSTVKLVNNNPKEIDVYVQVADFKSGQEVGTVKFIQSADESEEISKHLLSQWITIEAESMTIPAFQSKEIPFRINVPLDAEPGGHYAAILAGTKPPEEKIRGSTIKISLLLASLILLNVGGEVIEKGQIREFSVDKRIYSEPKVDFTVRFANTGNIHIQPQGEIKIYDFWGKDKGIITINHGTEFGNVLPQSIRKWNFCWEGEKSVLEMGRYKAMLVLSYGEEARETVDQTIYFWVVNFKLLLAVISTALLLILIIIFSVRTYIRRAIIKIQGEAGIIIPKEKSKKQKVSVIPKESNTVDFPTTIKQKTKVKVKEPIVKKYSWFWFKRYLKFIVVILFVILAVFLYFYYKGDDVSKTKLNRSSINDEKVDIIDTGEKKQDPEIFDNTAVSEPEAEQASPGQESISTGTSSKELEEKESSLADTFENKESLVIKVLNGSGVAGVAFAATEILSQEGFVVQAVGNADNYNYYNTVIKYKENNEQAAGLISKLFPEPVKMQEVEQQKEDIIVIVGSNFKEI